MRPAPTRILLLLFLLLSLSSLAAAGNFTRCLEEFRKDPDAIGGVDSRGHPTSPAKAVGLTYTTCTARCGRNPESFNWGEFAQLFSTWLLPWLALTTQLPFCSKRYDDLISVALTVGSPALAAYSLALTSLNVRLVHRMARRAKHENKHLVAKSLMSLQQAPVELTRDERLLTLVAYPRFWGPEITDRLTWTITTGSSIAWVVISYVFTLVDSFVDSTNSVPQGHAVGTLWLWLLCLVTGWLWVPAFTSAELEAAIGHANRRTAKTAARGVKRSQMRTYDSAVARATEQLLVPIFAPHNRSTPSFQMFNGGPQEHPSASANHATNYADLSLRRSDDVHSIASRISLNPETDRFLIPIDDSDSLNRDELRLAATFNYSRIIRYFVLVNEIFHALDKLEKDEKGGPPSEVTDEPVENAVFPPGLFASMFGASILALVLQCGTTVSATIIIVYTPTVGLGCRSLGYAIYGGIALLVMVFTIISTILARISETRRGSSRFSIKAVTAFIAVALRKISLSLAIINATGLIVLSCFQFSHFLDNCYCNSSVLGRGMGSYMIVSYEGWVSTMRNARIVGTVLSAASMVIYMIFISVLSSFSSGVDHRL